MGGKFFRGLIVGIGILCRGVFTLGGFLTGDLWFVALDQISSELCDEFLFILVVYEANN